MYLVKEFNIGNINRLFLFNNTHINNHLPLCGDSNIRNLVPNYFLIIFINKNTAFASKLLLRKIVCTNQFRIKIKGLKQPFEINFAYYLQLHAQQQASEPLVV